MDLIDEFGAFEGGMHPPVPTEKGIARKVPFEIV